MAVSISKTKLSVMVAVLLSLGFLQAQEAKPLARHPGDILKYEIKFSGPTADQIKSVDASLGLTSATQKDQPGFNTGVPGAVSHPSLDTYHVEMKVPDDIANGDYVLNVNISAALGSTSYNNGNGFTLPPVHIENPRTFVPPSIAVKQLP
jgi:hypothetical protein